MAEHERQNIVAGAGRRQVNCDHRLHFDNPCGDLDESQAQRVELRNALH
jgi:hypothetical protein